MKKLFLILTTAMVFISCTAVKFETPQPSAGEPLQEFPEKMLGTFVSNDQDTLYITPTSFRYSNGKEVNLEGTLSSSNVVLKKLKNTYLLNLKEDQGWDVFPLKLSRNKITAHYVNLDENVEELIQNLKQTSPVQEVRTDDGKFDHYLIAPSNEEFERLLRKKLFSEKSTFRRIR